MNLRIGQGIDFHSLEKGEEFWLGGIKIPSEKGCIAHSDGDVLLHAICDALLGAAGLEDIGHQFPDNSNEFKDIDSKILLSLTYEMISKKGFMVVNLDCTICLEKPKIAPYIQSIKISISKILETDPENITVKATTTEKMGFVGRGEGAAALAVVLLEKQ
jgi:2-C-methyl-D-erythritol 2,4-cyclodiphosphate synthase